jgi:mannitol-1-phosphate 5-dehydrogenase
LAEIEMKSRRTFVGFGFGPIQAGLFLYEAHRSGNFDRLVVAEVKPDIVARVRRDGGRYTVNVATPTGIERHEVTGVEILEPHDPKLALALQEATEVATALPSVDAYRSVAPLLRHLRGPCVVYAGENHNHAAEILEEAVLSARRASGTDATTPAGGVAAAVPAASSRYENVQFLNTVIGKMSGVTDDGFLVEEFNQILITQIKLPNFRRGIEVFVEKPDLLPFEEAKLYGHNAVHALLGYLANREGLQFVSDADAKLLALARGAFLEECGPALMARWGGVDALFTPDGWRAYAEDLLERMTNPFLRDRVERVIRDAQRKLEWNDRLIGTIRLALAAGIKPWRMALGAAAAMKTIGAGTELWPEANPDLIELIHEAQSNLNQWRNTAHGNI